jgi:hypothetical protein
VAALASKFSDAFIFVESGLKIVGDGVRFSQAWFSFCNSPHCASISLLTYSFAY